MSHNDISGPAFPTEWFNQSEEPIRGLEGESIDGQSVMQYSGMSMRDYFASAALQGIIACVRDHNGATTVKDRCAKAYEYADAMLAERAK